MCCRRGKWKRKGLMGSVFNPKTQPGLPPADGASASALVAQIKLHPQGLSHQAAVTGSLLPALRNVECCLLTVSCDYAVIGLQPPTPVNDFHTVGFGPLALACHISVPYNRFSTSQPASEKNQTENKKHFQSISDLWARETAP